MDYSELKNLRKSKQIEFMEEWFRDKYEDPVESTPYDSGEGGYIWIYGGPYDAGEELGDEFGQYVDEKLINRLAEHLSDECPYWTLKDKADFYDEEDYEIGTFGTLRESIKNVSDLSNQTIPNELIAKYYALLLANCVSILEAYLFDTFIKKTMDNQENKIKYLHADKSFQEKNIKFCDIYDQYEKIDDMIKDRLFQISWHNLPIVNILYKNTYGLDFDSFLPSMMPFITLRHDIVHRNGKDKEGTDVVVNLTMLEKLIKLVSDLAGFIEERINPSEY